MILFLNFKSISGEITQSGAWLCDPQILVALTWPTVSTR